MSETIIESVLKGSLDVGLLIKWLNDESIEDSEDCVLNCCDKNEFVSYFLTYLRNQTESIVQSNSSAAQLLQHNTPEKFLNSRKHHRSISDPTSADRSKDSLTVKSERHSNHESPNREKKRGRKVKTKLFPDDRNQSISSDESKLSIGVERLVISSTPLKNGPNTIETSLLSPVTPRCDTPRFNYKSRSHEKCLGDYIVNIKSTKKKKSKDSESLDLSNSEVFPEIGARKSSSLKSDKRRIKPTNIDKSQKSSSFNSFTEFQRPSLALEDNSLFKPQKLQPREASTTFDVERNILKQERHKLMEKFNLNATAPIQVMPQIKVTQKVLEKSKNFTKCDISKVTFKDKIDDLVLIYEVMMKNNLIMSINRELYFLITILISKQCEEKCLEAEMKLKENFDCLLEVVHNATYFAVKSLWLNRFTLEVILDKNSLKTLGENKNVRNFYPDLAKFLLNCYGLRCETESNQEKPRYHDLRPSNGVICFNSETDNVDNFPSALSFQNFRKQRDMFYEALRWYEQDGCIRSRVRTCIATGGFPHNNKHLSTLLLTHMMATCAPERDSNIESKLTKLQRRLTCSNTPESYRLPQFSQKEMFYKEFITYADNESFRTHLKDAFSTEIVNLDSSHISMEDKTNSNNEISKEFMKLSKKLFLLAKFLGFMTSLPYIQTAEVTKNNIIVKEVKDYKYVVPKDKVLENDLILRSYSQPTIDLKSILKKSFENSRLSITLPWIAHFLSMLEYTALRTKYYQELLLIIIEIYKNRLKMKKNTIVYIKSILGWLFDLPHFPQESFYIKIDFVSESISESLDSCDLIDYNSIQELCPFLKTINILLTTFKIDSVNENTYRHITPVSLNLNNEERTRNKEKELQLRLEEEYLKSQPSSTRRVLELVIERVTSSCIKQLTATLFIEAREKARSEARAIISGWGHDQATLLQALQNLYSQHIQKLKLSALQRCDATIKSRCNTALSALLSNSSSPLTVVAATRVKRRLMKCLNDNSNNANILCKDIKAEMKLLMSSDVPNAITSAVNVDAMVAADFDDVNVSPSTCIINLKEALCQLLDDETPSNLPEILSNCALACSPNNIFCRLPTQRAILQLSVDLCVIYVSRKPNSVTEQFLNSLHVVWNTCCPDRKPPQPQELTLPERRSELSPKFRNFDDEERIPTPESDDQETDGKLATSDAKLTTSDVKLTTSDTKLTTSDVKLTTSDIKTTESNGLLEFFDRILCPRNIVLFSVSKCKKSDVWCTMAAVIVFLLERHYLSEDSLTEQCLAVYRQDWSQSVLENLSLCMREVSSKWARSSTGKFTLFLDFLAEYCGDMDYDPIE